MTRRNTSKGGRRSSKSGGEPVKAPLVRSRSLAPRAPSTSAQPRTKKNNRRRSRSEETTVHRAPERLLRGLSRLGALSRRHRHLSVFALFGFGLAVAIVVVLRQTRSQLEDSEMFRLENIEIRGAARASTEEIESLLGVVKGDNLIALDTRELEGFVAQHPWVRRVEIERGLPKKLVVNIEEHEPVALVALGHLYYADAEGQIVKRRSFDEQDTLPVVTGFSRAEVEAADEATIEGLRRAVGFPRLLRETMGPTAPELDEVHFDEVMGLSFVTKNENLRVHVGSTRWESQIRKFGAVRTALHEKGLEAAEVMLGGDRRPERVVVRLARGRS